MVDIAWYDGTRSAIADVRIPLCDRSYYFADAVYEAAIGRNGKIYRMGDHIERLKKNLCAAGLSYTQSSDPELILPELCRACGTSPFFLYMQFGRDGVGRAHLPHSSDVHTLVTLTDHVLPDFSALLKLRLLPDRRHTYCNVKNTSLFATVLACRSADDLRADEAVYYRGETVTECAHSNVSILKDGILYTHPTDCHILPGISRARLLHFAKMEKIPIRETPFSRTALLEADEVLVSSSTRLFLRAGEIDGVPVGQKDARRASLLYRDMYEEYLDETE